MRKQPTRDTLRREHADHLKAEREASGWKPAAELSYRLQHSDPRTRTASGHVPTAHLR